MPRPDKDINPGRLDGPIAPSRAESWTKYGGPETAGGHRGAPSDLDHDVVDPDVVEVTIDDITVTQHPDEPQSKYMTRSTSAHGIGAPEVETKAKPTLIAREWVVDRIVEGRTYRRTDKLIIVELDG